MKWRLANTQVWSCLQFFRGCRWVLHEKEVYCDLARNLTYLVLGTRSDSRVMAQGLRKEVCACSVLLIPARSKEKKGRQFALFLVNFFLVFVTSRCRSILQMNVPNSVSIPWGTNENGVFVVYFWLFALSFPWINWTSINYSVVCHGCWHTNLKLQYVRTYRPFRVEIGLVYKLSPTYNWQHYLYASHWQPYEVAVPVLGLIGTATDRHEVEPSTNGWYMPGGELLLV